MTETATYETAQANRAAAWTPSDLLTMRHDAGLSQQSLADLLGVRVGTVSRWERGTRAIPPYLKPAILQLTKGNGK